MKRTLLVAVAAFVLSAPAMAMSPHNSTGTQQSNQQQDLASSRRNQRINPMQLTERKIRNIQSKLNAKGFNAGRVDGIWGPETASAVRDFQQHNGIKANGHLTQNTLAELGLKRQNGNMQSVLGGQAKGKNQHVKNTKTNVTTNKNAMNQTQSNEKGTVGAAPSNESSASGNMATKGSQL